MYFILSCGAGRPQGSPLEELCPNRNPSPMVQAAGMGQRNHSSLFLYKRLLQDVYVLQYAERDWLKLASATSLRVAGGICIPSKTLRRPRCCCGAVRCLGMHGEPSTAMVTPCPGIRSCLVPALCSAIAGCDQAMPSPFLGGRQVPGPAPWLEG